MKHINDWKKFFEGRIIDFNTRKEIESDDIESEIDSDTDTDNTNFNDIDNNEREDIVNDFDTDFDTQYDVKEYLDKNSVLYKRFADGTESIPIADNYNVIESFLKDNKKVAYRDMLLIPDIKTKQPSLLIVRSSPRSHTGYKIIQNYRYRTLDLMLASAKQFIEFKNKIVSDKENLKNKKKNITDTVLSNIDQYIKVGDIYYDSWGYEQTNIDFYQVISVEKSFATLQRIAKQRVEGTDYHDSAYVKPLKDQFIENSKPEKKKILVDTWSSSGNYGVYFKSDYGHISKYTKGDRGVYSSWGY